MIISALKKIFLTLLLSSPGLSEREAARIRTALGESGSNLRLPAIDAAVLRQIRSAPVALLRLYSITTHGNTAWRAPVKNTRLRSIFL